MMAIRRPQGNALVLAVLRSRAHRLLSGVAIELRYVGRRSGRRFALPVQYAQDGERLVVAPQRATSSTWWRNFRSPQPVQVRLRGRLHDGVARWSGPTIHSGTGTVHVTWHAGVGWPDRPTGRS